MQYTVTVQSGREVHVALPFHAWAVRVDNPGAHSIRLNPYAWDVQSGRVQVTQNFQQATTVGRIASTPLVPGAPTEPAQVTFYDSPQVLDSGQQLPTPDQLPAAPTDIAVTPLDSALTVSWQPVTASPPVTQYHIRVNFADPPYSATGTSFTITGLNNGQGYGITVSAVNAAGEGPSSGITYILTIANRPWQPIVEAVQHDDTLSLAGKAPDSYPIGTSPVWVVGAGATYTKNVGFGITLGGSQNFATIDPMGNGARTVSWGFFSTGAGTVYCYVIHDGVGNNWLALVSLVSAGLPAFAVYQRFNAGTPQLVGLFGTNYAADTWNYSLQARITAPNNISISGQAVNNAGTANLILPPSTVQFFQPLIQFSSFGFQLTQTGVRPTATQAMQAIAFVSP